MSSRAALSVPCPPPRLDIAADTEARSLYRRSLKLALDWSVHRELWRGQAVYIRSLFENNRNVTDPRLQRVRNTLSAEGRELRARREREEADI